MILLEIIVFTIMLLGTVMGLVCTIAAISEGEDSRIIFAFIILFFIGIGCGCLEAFTHKIEKKEYSLTKNSITLSDGYYTIEFFANGGRAMRTSDRKEIQLIKSHEPEELCIIHHQKVNVFETSSWAIDKFELTLCQSLNEE